MRKVFTCEGLIQANHIKNILEVNGVECFLKNDSLSGVIGEVPTVSSWPEVWLYDESQLLKAKDLIKQSTIEQSHDLTDWFCNSCQEQNASNFQICWQCSQQRSV